jgi:phosphoribosylaminoimidazole-succinocarboxamide synthase
LEFEKPKEKNMDMRHRKVFYEGESKIFYEGPEAGTLVQHFKDHAKKPVSNGNANVVTMRSRDSVNPQKVARLVSGKGIINNNISAFLMGRLNAMGIHTHFMRRLSMREQLVQKVEMIPVQVAVRNFSAGSFAKRFGIAPGTPLPRPIVEYYLKDTLLNSPMVSEEHILAFKWASHAELDDMVGMVLRLNDYLSGLFYGVDLQLIDFKVEFGRHWRDDEMSVVLADELSPDNLRLWDAHTDDRFDRDSFREDFDRVIEAYQEIARRLGVSTSTTPLNGDEAHEVIRVSSRNIIPDLPDGDQPA